MEITELNNYQAEVFKALESVSEPARRASAKNDKKSELDFLAVRVPALRRAVKKGFSFYQLEDTEILKVWDYIWSHSSYFEVMSAAAMYYGLLDDKVPGSNWPVLSHWRARVENWAHSDQISHIYSYLLTKRPEEVYQQFQVWNQSENQWLRRISIVSLIRYTGKKAVYLPPEKVIPLVENCLYDERYYVQKAVGWVLREMGHGYPEQVKNFIQDHLDMPSTGFTRAVNFLNQEDRAYLMQERKKVKG